MEVTGQLLLIGIALFPFWREDRGQLLTSWWYWDLPLLQLISRWERLVSPANFQGGLSLWQYTLPRSLPFLNSTFSKSPGIPQTSTGNPPGLASSFTLSTLKCPWNSTTQLKFLEIVAQDCAVIMVGTTCSHKQAYTKPIVDDSVLEMEFVTVLQLILIMLLCQSQYPHYCSDLTGQ